MKRIALLLLVAATAVTIHSCGDGGGVTPPQQNRPPVATGTIPAADLFVGDTLTLDVSSYFNDQDGDALGYTVTVSDTRVVSASVSGSLVTVAALAQGEAVVTVTAQDAGGLSAEQSFTVEVPNRSPVVTAELPAAELYVGESVTVDLSAHFEDPDGDALVYTAEVSAPGVAEFTVTGSELTVAALAQGEAVVTVTAQDAGGLSAEQSFTVEVPNRSPVVTAELPAAELYVGESVTVDLSAHFEDPDGDALVYTAEVSAPGVAEFTVTGSELTVAALAQGEAVVTVTAQDAGGLSAEQSFTVEVPNRSPVVTAELPAAELYVGESVTVDLSAHFEDPDGDALVYTAEVSAPGVAEFTVTGSELTVAALAQGEAVVTVTAQDAGGLSAEQSFTVEVPNRSPVVTAELPAAELYVGESVTVDLSAHFEDPDGDALVYTAEVSAPGVAEFTVTGSELTVAALAQGEAVVTVTAQDAGGLSAEQSFTVEVPNRSPVVTAELPAAELYVGESVTVDLSAHFEDPDGDALVYTAEVSAPGVAEFTVTGSELTVAALAQGEAVVTVTAQDAGGLSAEQSFTVEVPNRSPVVTAELPAAELYVGESVTVDLSAHFEDPDGDALVYTAEVSAPGVAEFTVTGSELTVAALAQGEAVVTVTAQDAGGLSAEQSFTVEVPNRSPVVTAELPAAELYVGESVTVDLSAHFEDPDGDALVYTAEVSAPGVAEFTVTGSELTVAALAQGEAVVTVTAQDAGGLSAEQSFTVEVPNRSPVVTAELPAAELYVGESVTVDLSAHFEDPDGDALVYTAEVSAPGVAEFTVTGSELTVAALAQGEAVVTVTAQDAGGLSAEQSFTVEVPNRSPVVTAELPAAELYVGESVTVDLSAHFEDPDGDALVYTAEVSAPGVAEFTVTGSELTVAALAQGEAVVTVTAQDAGGLSAEQGFAANVQPRAGYLHVEFQHGTTDMGALAVEVAGPAVDSVRVAPGLSVYSTATEEGLRLVLLGPIPLSGTLFSFWTDDVTLIDEYTVHAIEAVATSYEPRSLDGSSITVRR